jgi:hypothetical protein
VPAAPHRRQAKLRLGAGKPQATAPFRIFFADLSPIFPFVLPGLRFPILDRRNGLAIGQFKSPDAIMKNLTQNPPGITSFAIDDATNYANVAVDKFASLVPRISDITSSHQARR